MIARASLWIVLLGACSRSAAPAVDAAPLDAPSPDAPADASNACRSTSAGAAGECVEPAACTGAHVGVAGSCTSATVTCCIDTPSVALNPPIPTGWKYMTNAMVTPAMTTWAVMILHDPVMYPMFATTQQTFGAQLVMARVEWHPPDFQNSVVHRGVSLFVPN